MKVKGRTQRKIGYAVIEGLVSDGIKKSGGGITGLSLALGLSDSTVQSWKYCGLAPAYSLILLRGYLLREPDRVVDQPFTFEELSVMAQMAAKCKNTALLMKLATQMGEAETS